MPPNRTQVPGTLAYDLEHSVANAFDRLRRPDGPQVYRQSRDSGTAGATFNWLNRLRGPTIHCLCNFKTGLAGSTYACLEQEHQHQRRQ
jgi:hypothetical protein